ncbi:hypothetical protein [Fulvimarina pelagi]|nr:hypothetical protein [Fulvimarina pelagi]
MTNVLKNRLTAFSLGAVLAFGLSAQAFSQTGTDATTPDAGMTTENGQSETGAPTSEPQAAAEEGAQLEGEAPSNQVGEKFELPRYSEGNQIELITGLCGIQLKEMSQPACGCLAEASLDNLSDPQRDYLIASVIAPPVSDRMLGDGRVTESDQAEIFGFLQTYSETCKAEVAGTDGSTPSTGGAGESAAPDAATEAPAAGSGAADAESETAN